MISSAFQGVLDVYMATAINNYVPQVSPWHFQRGNPWPVTAQCHLSHVGFEVAGFQLDIFDLLKMSDGRVTTIKIGDLTGTNSGSTLPCYWNGRVAGWTGGSFGSGSTVYRATNYDLPAIPGQGYTLTSFPRAFQTTFAAGSGPTFEYGWQSGINCNFLSFKNGQRINPAIFFTNSNHVLMADTVNYSFAAPADLYHPLPLGQSSVGTIPGTNYYLTQNSVTPDCGIAYIGTSQNEFIYQTINYDNATVNTALNDQQNGLANAMTTVFGWLYYWPSGVNGSVTFNGITYSTGLVLVSPDGTKYWWINMIPADQAMATVLAGSQGGVLQALAHMTPDGSIWFQSGITKPDHIFTPAAGSPVIKGLPIYWTQTLPHSGPDPYEYGEPP